MEDGRRQRKSEIEREEDRALEGRVRGRKGKRRKWEREKEGQRAFKG